MLNACHDGAAIDVANALANTDRPLRGEDLLETVAQLRDFLEEHGLSGRRPPTEADLAAVREVRGMVRAALERAGSEPHAAAALINDGLLRARAVPMLRPDGELWRAELVAGDEGPAARLGATAFGALASVVATLGPSRLGVCAGTACRATFVDLSRNGSKQYCTRTCAHRASVAAYRGRRNTG